jgi:hypothetical protein
MSKKIIKVEGKFRLPPVVKITEEERAAVDSEHVQEVLNRSFSKKQFKDTDERTTVYTSAEPAIRSCMARSAMLFGKNN